MIIGHQNQWQFLKKSVRLQKISHAYLFYGQEKLGKRTTALEFAKLIIGSNSFLQNPDLILVEPEKKVIQISQIRDLIRKLSLKPYSAPAKVAIINRAHLMTKDSQNSLLKTLEEPKGRTLLILITEVPEALFSTIRSRCEIIKFFPVRKIEIKNYLQKKGFPLEKCEEVSNLCLGRPGEAIDFISEPQKLENRRKIIKELVRISSSSLSKRFQYANDLSKASPTCHPNLKEVLEIWLFYFRDVLLKKTNLLSQSDDREMLSRYSFPKLKTILSQIQNTNSLLISTNINPRLALEVLMLEL